MFMIRPTYLLALRLRLGLRLASEGDCCHVFNQSTRAAYGRPLTPHTDRAPGCAMSARKAGHNALRHWFAAVLRASCARALTEQSVAEYAPVVPLRADIRAIHSPGAPAVYYDVVIAHPFTTGVPQGVCGRSHSVHPDPDAAGRDGQAPRLPCACWPRLRRVRAAGMGHLRPFGRRGCSGPEHRGTGSSPPPGCQAGGPGTGRLRQAPHEVASCWRDCSADAQLRGLPRLLGAERRIDDRSSRASGIFGPRSALRLHERRADWICNLLILISIFDRFRYVFLAFDIAREQLIQLVLIICF